MQIFSFFCSYVDLCRSFLQRELAEHEVIMATSKANLAALLGTDSEPVSEIATRHTELEHQLEEAGKLAALLQADADDRDRHQSQLVCDIDSLMGWVSNAVEELNQLSIGQASESDDELLRRHNAVKVTMHFVLILVLQ